MAQSTSPSQVAPGSTVAQTRAGRQKAAEEERLCPVCEADLSRRKGNGRQARIVCTSHWTCVRTSSHESLESVDKFYCASCTLASACTAAPVATTYKNQRKSSRSSAQNRLDYANLDAHLPADANRWLAILATRPVVEHAFRRFTAAELTDEWLWGEESMKEPWVVDEEEGLGMEMPRKDLGIGEIAELVGKDTPLEVIDCAAQEALAKWTLGQWATYYEDAKRNKIRNVISLEVTESKLGKDITPPAFVRKLDWVANYWPQKERGPGEYPTVMRYCLMSVKGGFTDWHVDFAGSCVFYNVRRGKKVFYFIRPTKDNLAAYERWSGSKEMQDSTWLGDLVDEVYKVELSPGNTMTIPTGWIHAVYTPEDSLVFGGNYLHSLEIPTQLAIYRIELATKVPIKYRYPHFVKLTWMVANRYYARLAELEQEPGADWPIDLGPRVLRGLKELAAFLIEQVARFAKGSTETVGRQKVARDNVPWDIVPDPAETASGLRRKVMRVLGEEWDRLGEKEKELEPKKEGATKSPSPAGSTGSLLPPSAAPPIPPAQAPSPATALTRKRKAPAASTATATSPATKPKLAMPRALAAKTTLNSTASPTPINHPLGQPSPLRATKGLPALGTLIESRQSPVVTSDRVEPRLDPGVPGQPERLADVRVCTSTTMAVRRRVVEAGREEEGEEEGMVVLEVTKMVTTRERVRIPRVQLGDVAGVGAERRGSLVGMSVAPSFPGGVGAAAYPPGAFSHVPAPAGR